MSALEFRKNPDVRSTHMKVLHMSRDVILSPLINVMKRKKNCGLNFKKRRIFIFV